ncbi:MAG: NAD(P)-dependent glycerol-3-phosphate dehydrogenase [Deltaproteobacteria bacterium]|jgi:glycerol-3-phosphate dehydrogenase (NAD(P)+)|nr:NAD(P)-dependent glycerol-3-phosphate dehydrogenase [Deltaproteobacteria bacterium]
MKTKNEIDPSTFKIAVVGAGSWGTAIADLLACKGFKISLWVFETEVRVQIEQFQENRLFLPGHTLSTNISPSNDLAAVVSDKNLIVIVVPSHLMRAMTNKMSGYLSERTVIVSASKGIEQKTHLTMSGVIKEKLPDVTDDLLAVISGPSFAKEVVQKMPTSVTVACKNPDTAAMVQHAFATDYFRVYTSDDVTGVELGGAVKNVIAIAAGILDGLGLGLNTRAALMTRGMTEVRRLGLHLGANPRTFTGLAGFGDLVLTCTGNLSRNYTVGVKLGRGQKLQEILGSMHMVAEGVKTAKSVYNFSRKLKVEMPICHEIYRILYKDLTPKEAVHRLMTRALKQELDED